MSISTHTKIFLWTCIELGIPKETSRPLIELFKNNKVKLTPDKYNLIVTESGIEIIGFDNLEIIFDKKTILNLA